MKSTNIKNLVPLVRNSNSSSRLTRRILLTSLACSWIFPGYFAQANIIGDENLQPGTTAWELTNPVDNHQIEGYASLTSVPVGGDIDFFVNTRDATYSLAVYRMGWYGGKGGRLMFGPQTLTGVQQVIPAADPATGLIECQWTNPFTLHVANAWVSGIYLVKLHGNSSGKESYIIFCVRDSRQADLVFQQSVTTYEAYNGWPSANSLYDQDSAMHILYDRVSFNRPYAAGDPPQGAGAGDFLGMGAPVAIEYSMVRWLERKAYDVTYITNVDTHEDVGRLTRGKGFLSVGHDEYWSYDMKGHVIQARDQGVGLGFFSANYVFWPIDLEPSSSGVPNRTVSVALDNRCVDAGTGANQTTVCAADSDCSNGQVCLKKVCNFTCLKDASGVSETEQTLVGGMWDPGHLIDHRYGGDIVVTSDALVNHWVFANTGLQVGDVLPGLIGVEWNATVDDPHYPKPPGLQVLLHTQVPHFAWPNPPGGPNPPSGGWPLLSGFDGKDFDGWYKSWAAVRDGDPPGQLDPVCHHDKIGPYEIAPTHPFCSNPWPDWSDVRFDWGMTIYQASSGAWVFNAATMEWGWGLDDYFTGLTTPDGANNGPPVRTQCGYAWFHPNLVSCRNDAVAQITRNVLSKYQAPDSTAPVSALTIGTPQYTGSGGQLFVAGATPFTLTARDDSSGVWNVWYRFFPSGSSNPPSYTFVEGFQANFNLSGADGSYEVDSYATDNAGNDESPAHVQSVYLDNTPPLTTIAAPVATQYLHSDAFTISYSVSDGGGSGVKTNVPDIDGQTTLFNGTTHFTVANGLMVTLLTELSLGTHTFDVNSVDNVENASSATVTFSIIVTPDSIKTEVNQFFAMGAIRNHGLVNSLLGKLNAAANARARSNCRTASNNYVAFIHELQAQSGKGVNAQAAAILISDAQYLIAHCP